MAHKPDRGKGEGTEEPRGLFGGLSQLIEQLGELADKGRELREVVEFQSGGKTFQGVYGFNIKAAVDPNKGREFKVEPFGNVRRDPETGQAVVHEVIEPMVDVFEEADRVQVVAEMPGVGEGDIHLELRDDLLAIEAARGPKKYRKEVLLPASFTPDQMSHSAHNGILEITLRR